LRTTDKAVALDRYPAAMRWLKLNTQGIQPVQVITPSDNTIDWVLTKKQDAVSLLYQSIEAANIRSGITPLTRRSHG
jgi:hypothetical protein